MTEDFSGSSGGTSLTTTKPSLIDIVSTGASLAATFPPVSAFERDLDLDLRPNVRVLCKSVGRLSAVSFGTGPEIDCESLALDVLLLNKFPTLASRRTRKEPENREFTVGLMNSTGWRCSGGISFEWGRDDFNTRGRPIVLFVREFLDHSPNWSASEDGK